MGPRFRFPLVKRRTAAVVAAVKVAAVVLVVPVAPMVPIIQMALAPVTPAAMAAVVDAVLKVAVVAAVGLAVSSRSNLNSVCNNRQLSAEEMRGRYVHICRQTGKNQELPGKGQ